MRSRSHLLFSAVLGCGVLMMAKTASAAPSVSIIVNSPLEELPQPPDGESFDTRQLFSAAQTHQRFRRALHQHLQHLKKEGATQAQITSKYKQAHSRLLKGLSSLSLATHDRRQQAVSTEALHLKHLEVWLTYSRAQFEWEDALDAANTNDDEDALDRIGDGPKYSDSLALLAEISASPDPYAGRGLAMLQYSYLQAEVGSHEKSLDTARKLACPGATTWTPESYAQCTPVPLSPDHQTFLWMQLIGRAHFESASALPLAVAAYRRAAAAGGQNAAIAHYQLGWSHYRQDHFDQAIASFGELLNNSHGAASQLHPEARIYIAISLVEEWIEKTQAKDKLVDHVDTALSQPHLQGHRIALLKEVLQVANDMELDQQAPAIERLLERARQQE